MLDEIYNIVGSMLCFNLILILKTKNCIVATKTTSTEPIQTALF